MQGNTDDNNNNNNTPNFKPIQPRSYNKSYPCSLCGRSFSNPQALGGHKRAHRKEMEVIRASHAVCYVAPPCDHDQPHSTCDYMKTSSAKQVNATSSNTIATEKDETSIDLELRLSPCGVDDHLSLRL